MWQNKHYQKYARKKIETYKKKKQHYIETNKQFTGVKFREKIHPCLRQILRIQHKILGLSYEIVDDKSDLKQGETVIYAVTHIGKYDFEMVMDAYCDFAYPIAGDWELMYGEIDDYFLRLNGVLYVDTSDSVDRKNSTRAIVKMLNQGIPILIFPEGVWNLTESLPMMKIFPGAVRAAKECNVPIVPVAVEQYDKHFLINVGEKIYVGDDEQRNLQNMRDVMATLQWENWEHVPIGKRSDVPDDYYQKFVENKLQEWSQFNMDIINGRMYKDKTDRELEAIIRDLNGLRNKSN